MEEINTKPAANQSDWMKYPVTAFMLVILILVGFLSYAAMGHQVTSVPSGTTSISQSTLEEQYGLRVNLIGVTAAGGMVDVRLKILDIKKAEILLKNSANLPKLIVVDGRTTLAIPQANADDLRLENGGIVFFLFPNTGGVVKPGMPVIVKLGELELEPIPAQ